ncbi:helix-turn-helix domain-containing protein [Nocardioides sp. MH1]|uniref:helix-turn-helix domain-containing protein n=1 Tax=Nocardioides sp. MH1 TaxID=3242490 RepID=UPI00352040C4
MRPAQHSPRTFIEGAFLDGEVAEDAPAAAFAAREVARRLAQALESSGRTRVEVADAAGVSRSAMYALLRGDVYPDFATVAQLSAELDTPLWPRVRLHGRGLPDATA